MINRVVTIFGGLFFIYIFAKAIPSSIRSYKLKKQELVLEGKRLEVEKLRLELEAKKYEKEKSKKTSWNIRLIIIINFKI